MKKRCSKCRLVKELCEFWKQPKGKFGHEASCSKCGSDRFREWVNGNLRRRKAYKHTYRKMNAVKIAISARRYKLKNKEAVRRYWNLYSKKNKEKLRKMRKAYYAKNKDKLLRKCREWRSKNRDRDLLNHKIWGFDNPEAVRAIRARRRAGVLGAAIRDFTKEQWALMKDLHGHKCVYCGCKPKTLTQDHVIPLSKNGNHTWSNILPACGPCNSRKKDKFFLNSG